MASARCSSECLLKTVLLLYLYDVKNSASCRTSIPGTKKYKIQPDAETCLVQIHHTLPPVNCFTLARIHSPHCCKTKCVATCCDTLSQRRRKYDHRRLRDWLSSRVCVVTLELDYPTTCCDMMSRHGTNARLSRHVHNCHARVQEVRMHTCIHETTGQRTHLWAPERGWRNDCAMCARTTIR